jgi:hypothetical protein
MKITGVFLSSNREQLGIELDDGDGGVLLLDVTIEEVPQEVDGLEGEWVRIGP